MGKKRNFNKGTKKKNRTKAKKTNLCALTIIFIFAGEFRILEAIQHFGNSFCRLGKHRPNRNTGSECTVIRQFVNAVLKQPGDQKVEIWQLTIALAKNLVCVCDLLFFCFFFLVFRLCGGRCWRCEYYGSREEQRNGVLEKRSGQGGKHGEGRDTFTLQALLKGFFQQVQFEVCLEGT